jgi:IclR family transcriptional regulator, acetate operon repressor
MKAIPSVKTRAEADDPLSTTASPSLERGLAVLELLSRHPTGRTLSELASELGLAGASVFRIGTSLEQLGYVDRDPATKRFTLTNRFLRLGLPGRVDRSLTECAIELMRSVRRATGETTQLCCLADIDMVIIEQLISTFPFKYSADIGARCPLYSCAPGKAIAAFLPPEELDALLPRLKLKRFTETTITSKTELRRELEEVKRRGYAIDRAEGMTGIHCVAAPILDRHGAAIAAITIAGPASRVLSEEFASIGKIVKNAALQTSEAFNS